MRSVIGRNQRIADSERDRLEKARSEKDRLLEDRSFEDVPAFSLSCRGIVTLARRRGQGKVAKKARIPVVPSRLHVSDHLERFRKPGIHELSGV